MKPRSRSIYLLPNLFTTGALFSGFYSLIASFQAQYATAAIAILVALLLDGLDGRVARLTNTATAFGAEYDSMADMVSFGAAPAFLMYAWSLSSLPAETWGQLGWVVAFVYCACCGLRLARFNVAVGTADKRFFQGLACPAAASTLASFVWVNVNFGNQGEDLVVVVLLATLVTGGLMVSNFAYYSFKDMTAIRKVPFATVLALLLLFVTTAVDPPKMVLMAMSSYAASGPAWALISWYRKRRARSQQS